MATIEHGLRQRPIQEKKSGINKKIAALALTGAVALGGIGIFTASQQGEQTRPEPTPITGGIGNTNETNNPSITFNPEQTPSETENNPENNPGVFAVNTWLDMLSDQQETEENNKFLNFEVKNKEVLKDILENLNTVGEPAEPLKVSFLGGYISPSPIADGKFEGHKMNGEVEFNNVTLYIDDQELTAADKSNGYEFKGLAEISYGERYSNYFYEPESQDDISNKENVLEWIHKPEVQDPNFSDWKDGSVKFPIAMVNGKWVAKLDNLKKEAFGSPKDSYNGFLIPFDSFYSIGCGEQQSSCKIIYKDLPYN